MTIMIEEENMNRFIIERSPIGISQSLCDQHIVKMPLEEAQMLFTTLWHHAPNYAPVTIEVSADEEGNYGGFLFISPDEKEST